MAASARAMQIRCRCPPENSTGRRLAALEGRPTSASSSATRAVIPAGGASRWTRSTSASAEPTVRRGFRDAYGSWNTTWMRRRSRRSCRGPSAVSSSPSRSTRPLSGRSSRLTQRASVDFPEPLSPTIPSTAPRATVSETSLNAGRPVRYSLERRSATSSGGRSIMPQPPERAARCGCSGRGDPRRRAGTRSAQLCICRSRARSAS